VTRACLVHACGAPVVSRGRCAKHGRQVDAARSVGTDRQAGAALYQSREWRELRALVIGLHPFCMCGECVSGRRRWPSTVVHHRDAHGGDPRKFFDVRNLIALSKGCHDRITAGARGGSFSGDRRVAGAARPSSSNGRRFGVGGWWVTTGGRDGERGA
jgi:hypothetical protein